MSELQFPKDPIIGQQYDFPPYRYYWDGIKWKTTGIGYNPVNDLRDELEPRIEISEKNIEDLSAQSFEALRRSYAEAGLTLVDGSFEEGATVTLKTQVIWQQATGKVFAWFQDGVKTVGAGSTPATSGGIGINAWVDRTQDTLRSDLNVVVKTFDSISSMVADTSLYVGQVVEWLSYHAGTKIGGNRGIVVAAGTGAPDGGSLFNLSSGLQVKAFIDPYNPVSPLLFGAKGGFASGDDAYVLAAMNFAGTTQLDLSAGFLLESSTLSISKPLIIFADGMYGSGGLHISHNNVDIFEVVGTGFKSNGFVLKDIRITSTSSSIQNLFSPKVPQAWRTFKNIFVSGVKGNLFNHSATVDTYCQRWEVDRLEARNCGNFSGITGDINTVLPRPFGTFATFKDIAFYEYYGVSGQTSIADLRGWRSISGFGGFEFTTNQTIASSINSLFGIKSNGHVDFDTIWYEPGTPEGSVGLTSIFSFDRLPNSTVDGYSGAPVVIKVLETIVDMYLCTFGSGTDYDVTIEDVCPVLYLRRSISNCCNFGTLLTNTNTVHLSRVNRGPYSDYYIPNSLFGVLSVGGVWGKRSGVVNPPMVIEPSPVVWSWRGSDNILPSSKPAHVIFGLSLADSSIVTKEIVTIDESLALHLVAASTCPKMLFNFNIPSDFLGSWLTISIKFKVINTTPGCIVRIAEANSGTFTHAYFSNRDVQYGSTNYVDCLMQIQPGQTTVSLKALCFGTAPATPIELYIKGIEVRVGRSAKNICDF